MDVWMQSDSDSLGIENFILKEILSKSTCRLMHSFHEVSTPDMVDLKIPREALVVGDLNFMGLYFKLYHGIKQINPIEIPDYIRTKEFLLRDYEIYKPIELEDLTGTYFVKDASKLKSFAGVVDFDRQTKDWISKEAIYIVSDVVDILSEYRCYVIGGELQNCVNYNGDPYVLPDMSKIRKAVGLVNTHEKHLKSYTIDVMVTPKGTALIEIHDFMAVGLYGTLWGDNLVYAYRDGMDYILDSNENRLLK